MNKKEIDIQLIEACVLEKWNPIAMGCEVEGKESENCVLCQFYWDLIECNEECPIKMESGRGKCNNTPHYNYMDANTDEEYFDAIEEEIEYLISLLPEDHPWRNI